jgi:hypothetical protein
MKVDLNKKTKFAMNIKHHTAQLQDIKAGDNKDNAQYIYLYFENNSRKVKELFICKLTDGSEYTGRLFGKPEIFDSEGKEIIDCKIYLKYMNDNKMQLLHHNRLAGIELVNKLEKVQNVFTSMGDCFKWLEGKETMN